MDLRIRRLKNWLFQREITYQAIAKRIGVSIPTVARLLNSASIPSHRREQLLGLGVPEDMLPPALDQKSGPKPRNPQFPNAQGQ